MNPIYPLPPIVVMFRFSYSVSLLAFFFGRSSFGCLHILNGEGDKINRNQHTYSTTDDYQILQSTVKSVSFTMIRSTQGLRMQNEYGRSRIQQRARKKNYIATTNRPLSFRPFSYVFCSFDSNSLGFHRITLN